MTPTNTCLDAETLAAWVDGGLSKNDAAMAEAHVSSCPRCQTITGLIVKTTPATTVDAPWWRAAWLIPAAAGAAAVGLWIIAPTNPKPSPEPTGTVAKLESAPGAVAPAAPAVAPPAAAPGRVPQQPGQRQDLKQERELGDRFRALAKDKAPERRAETPEEKQREARANAAADAAAVPPAAAPPAVASGRLADEQAARQSSAPTAAKKAVSPGGALHWRITDRGALERSTDGGTTWEAVNVGITATFTTVQAPEPRTALVMTSDGRVFRTSDGGKTWRLVPP